MALKEFSTCPGKLLILFVFTIYTSTLLTYISMITYPNYKYYWPIRALGLYAKKFGNEAIV